MYYQSKVGGVNHRSPSDEDDLCFLFRLFFCLLVVPKSLEPVNSLRTLPVSL